MNRASVVWSVVGNIEFSVFNFILYHKVAYTFSRHDPKLLFLDEKMQMCVLEYTNTRLNTGYWELTENTGNK